MHNVGNDSGFKIRSERPSTGISHADARQTINRDTGCQFERGHSRLVPSSSVSANISMTLFTKKSTHL